MVGVGVVCTCGGGWERGHNGMGGGEVLWGEGEFVLGLVGRLQVWQI